MADQTPPPEQTAARPKAPDVRADAIMTEAARAILRFHAERAHAQLDDARAGDKPQAVHKLRVAVRRQRAALKLFGPYFKPKALRPLRRGLKTLAGRLGAVRDLDVALDAARQYQASLSLDEAAAFDPLLMAWAAERAAAQTRLLKHLESRSFKRLNDRLDQFLDTPGAGERRAVDGTEPVSVPAALPAQLWQLYGGLRAFAPLLAGAGVAQLHALRIAGKHLRDALEFFAPVLGPRLAPVLLPVVALQDHLGELHDVAVRLDRLAAFQQRRHPRAPKPARRAVAAYAAQQQARLDELCRTATRPFKHLTGRAFRQALGQAAAYL